MCQEWIKKELEPVNWVIHQNFQIMQRCVEEMEKRIGVSILGFCRYVCYNHYTIRHIHLCFNNEAMNVLKI